MEYYNKYLKYKNKYLNLKHIGGMEDGRRDRRDRSPEPNQYEKFRYNKHDRDREYTEEEERKNFALFKKLDGLEVDGVPVQPCWEGITPIYKYDQDGYWANLIKKIPDEKPIRGIMLHAHSYEGDGIQSWTNPLDIPIYIQFFHLNHCLGPIKINIYDDYTDWFSEFNELLKKINTTDIEYIDALQNMLIKLTQNEECSANESPVHLLKPYFIGAKKEVNIPDVTFSISLDECNLEMCDSGWVVDMDEYKGHRFWRCSDGDGAECSSFILDFCKNPPAHHIADRQIEYTLEEILDKITNHVHHRPNGKQSIVIFMSTCRGLREHYESDAHSALCHCGNCPKPNPKPHS